MCLKGLALSGVLPPSWMVTGTAAPTRLTQLGQGLQQPGLAEGVSAPGGNGMMFQAPPVQKHSVIPSVGSRWGAPRARTRRC